MPITHSKVSAVTDGGDTDLVRPVDWNDDHAGGPDTYESILTANIVMVNATTWYTSATELILTPPAGDYLVMGHLSLTSASALVTFLGAQLSKGGSIASGVLTGQTVITEGGAYNPANNGGGQVSITIFGRVTVNGSEAIHLSGLGLRGSSDGTIVDTNIVSGTANVASNLVAQRITSA